MTMDANELRALADALSRQRQADEHGIYCAVPRQAVDAAIKYLRAQADAQPVAWMYEHDGCVDTPLFTVNRWTKCEEPWNESPLFLHPAPAAPQAEPIDPHMIVAEDRFPDVPVERWKPCPQCGEDVDRECPICDGLGRVLATDGEQAEPKREDQPLRDLLAIIHCDGGHHTEAVGIEQSIKNAQAAVCALKVRLALAEPKREPLSDERIDTALQTDPVLITRLMIGSMTVSEFRAALRRLARIVERAHGIGGSNEHQ